MSKRTKKDENKPRPPAEVVRFKSVVGAITDAIEKSLCGGRYSVYELWDRFLNYSLSVLNGDEIGIADALRHYEESREHFDAAFKALKEFSAVENKDVLGTVYMILGRSQSRFGQFFTRPEEADFLARVGNTTLSTLPETAPAPDDPFMVFDPACGAGSLLVACAGRVPREWIEEGLVLFYGRDVDASALKMCRVNFALYGLYGEVEQGNALELMAAA